MTPLTTDTPELLTAQEAADYLGRSVDTMSHWRWKRRGPAYHVRIGRIFYSKVDIDAWLAEQVRYVDPSVAS